MENSMPLSSDSRVPRPSGVNTYETLSLGAPFLRLRSGQVWPGLARAGQLIDEHPSVRRYLLDATF